MTKVYPFHTLNEMYIFITQSKIAMKINYLIVILLFVTLGAYAQQDTTYWTRGFTATANLSQLSLTNWSAGGQNSVALNSGLFAFAQYTKANLSWNNKIDLAYGFINKKDDGYVKSDDKINVTTEFGYLFSPRPNRWKWTTLLDFKTQFDAGYNYPNDSVKISGFMTPGYLTIVTGLEYSPRKFITFLYSPVTGKLTFVRNQRLANLGSFGVDPAVYDTNGVLLQEGSNLNSEFGTYFRILFEKEIIEHTTLRSKAEFFSDYLNDFGTVDVNWETNLDMKINSFLSATMVFHLIYDKDIRFDKTDASGTVIGTEPRVQFKEFIGIGFKYSYANREL